jgi:hypothetical protein
VLNDDWPCHSSKPTASAVPQAFEQPMEGNADPHAYADPHADAQSTLAGAAVLFGVRQGAPPFAVSGNDLCVALPL